MYPDYRVSTDTQNKWQQRKAQEEMLTRLRQDLTNGKAVKTATKYYVSLPAEEAHHKSHKTGGMHAMAQRVHPKVIMKIHELVGAGISEVSEVKRALKLYITKELCPTDLPNRDDRAYYPTNHDLSNHIHKAKSQLQLSKLDQENLGLKIDEWKKNSPDSKLYFRPYKKKSPKQQLEMVNTEDEVTEYEQTLLWIHQESWQQDLLIKYGNTITLMDATYKTTQYELALFFLTVRTNVGYSVVAEFVIQHEKTEDIAEALKFIKQWNPQWSPKFFMSDYSEAEITAVEQTFPTTKLYLCDFHREQSWERWIKNHQNGVSPDDQETILELLRSCAWAPPPDPTEGLPVDVNYQKAVKNLKENDIWIENSQLQSWLNTTWFSIPQVC